MWAHVGRGGLFVFWVLRRLRRASVGRMAASLAFTTLLGIVPLFTVALAYVARFPVFERWLDTDCLRSARGFAAFSDLDLCFVGHPVARRRGDGDACRTRGQGAQSMASRVTISIAQVHARLAESWWPR